MYVRELVVSYRRRHVLSESESRSIATPREAAALFASIMGEEAVEVFGILCLTTKHRLIAYHQISRGGIDCTVVSPREVFQVALLSQQRRSLSGTTIRAAIPRHRRTTSGSPAGSGRPANSWAST